jgi:thymidylate kinase
LRSGRFPSDTITALSSLLDDLAARGIRYCLWKSNDHLADALAGRTDLDVLVAREDAERFRTVVHEHGCKPLVPQPYAVYPGMEHFLGIDRETGRLFHLHVHTQLVLGERYVKNHRLPIEQRMLGSLRMLDGVFVPTPDVELAVLCLRTLLKYRGRDVVKDVLRIRTPGVPDATVTEVRWLLSQTSVEATVAVLAGQAVPLDPTVIGRLLDTILASRRAGWELLRLRHAVRTALRGSSRTGRVRATAAYLATVWRRREHLRRTPVLSGMRPATGGVGFALLGADGAGKSTIAETLGEWLGWKLIVRSYYMGSKQPSVSSRLTYLGFRAFRRGTRAVERRTRPGSPLARPTAWTRNALLALHHVSIGRDRRRRYDAARRDLMEGNVVIFDRFPMDTVSRDPEHRLLDGPQIPNALRSSHSRLVGRLARSEERIYGGFRLPDELIVLLVSPDVSIARKPDHDPGMLERKGRAVADLAHLSRQVPGTTVTVIDADRPLDEVLRGIEDRVWYVL